MATKNSKFDFKLFTEKALAETASGWSDDAANGLAFQPDVDQTISWAESHSALNENGVAYGVFRIGEPIALGICELVITKRSRSSKWVKMLRLKLRPKTEQGIYANDPAALQEAYDAYSTCIVGVFHVKNQHQADTMKVYGRTHQQMQFLNGLALHLKANRSATFKTNIEGRWLVLTWDK